MTAIIIFVLGLVGFVSRRNFIIMFLCTEIMFQGVVIAMAAFSRFHLNVTGQTFIIFVLSIAAAEAAVALGLVVLLYRHRGTLDVRQWSDLKG